VLFGDKNILKNFLEKPVKEIPDAPKVGCKGKRVFVLKWGIDFGRSPQRMLHFAQYCVVRGPTLPHEKKTAED